MLYHVNAELSAVDIPESSLWSTTCVKNPAEKSSDQNKEHKEEESVLSSKPSIASERERYDRYKIYLYIVEKKCIGLCLVERISRAHKTDESTSPIVLESMSSSISISSTTQSVVLGVSRIWTCSSYRRLGIASILVNCASENFIYGMRVEKSLVAFSQPTETGGYFARSWTIAKNGDDGDGEKKQSLLVYIEE